MILLTNLAKGQMFEEKILQISEILIGKLELNNLLHEVQKHASSDLADHSRIFLQAFFLYFLGYVIESVTEKPPYGSIELTFLNCCEG